MKIVFLSYGGFSSINSASQIFALANELVRRGHDCVVAVPEAPDDVELVGVPRFRAVSHSRLEQECTATSNPWRPDIFHCWTPREIVRRVAILISEALGCPYVVHLEDNEDLLTAQCLGIEVDRLLTMSSERLDEEVPLERAHPLRYRQFLAGAAGASVIIESLLGWIPPEKPTEVVWPGPDEAYYALPARDEEFRSILGITPEETVITYPGNSHSANRDEIRSLYLSVALLSQEGFKTCLLRLGGDHCDLFSETWNAVRPFCIELGARGRDSVLRPTAAADILVQPGRPGPFNDHRFPSKVPDFLASGRPVILPRTNIGWSLRDGEECLLLEEGNSLDIAEKVKTLIRDPDLRRSIAQRGREFARRELTWERAAEKLEALYDRALSAGAARGSHRPQSVLRALPRWNKVRPADLEKAVQRYRRNHPVPPVSYATVRDFCDSVDHLRALATTNGDMKDCQRPWMFKAVLGNVPLGGNILEFGAGEPIVAELLRCAGYNVWVVDPYDGSDNGPVEYDLFVREYPELHIIRNRFTNQVDELNGMEFDCIYSISVLEHLSTIELSELFSAVNKFLRPGGLTLHAIDHVLRGHGAAIDRKKASEIVRRSGLSLAELGRIFTWCFRRFTPTTR